MIKPIGLEELVSVAPVPGQVAARTVAQLTDPLKRRIVWFLQWQSHQDGGLKKFAHQLLWENGRSRLGSPTMHRIGFTAETYFTGKDFEAICDELDFHPMGKIADLERQLEYPRSLNAFELYEFPDTPAGRAEDAKLMARVERERQEVREKLAPGNRRAAAASFLYVCREPALQMPALLESLCRDIKAAWDLRFFHDLIGALEDAANRQCALAASAAASTKLAGIVQDALNFAHRTRSLVVIKGVERLGKTEAARRWVSANPEKARLISLSAGTTDSLFYGEIFEALGCGERKNGTSSELRSAIKDTLQNRDVALVFDEAHCLFGLSEKASIKRLEYIRTEFVNRGIPVVLIITPQFATRLSDLEKKTSFNVNQFRGRIARWVELPRKPSRADIECLCKFCLPSESTEIRELLVNFALESEYPFAAVKQAITEAKELLGGAPEQAPLTEQLVKKAIGFALFTSSQLSATLPRASESPTRSRRHRVVSAAAMTPADPQQPPSNAVAPRVQEACTDNSADDFSVSTQSSRAQAVLTY